MTEKRGLSEGIRNLIAVLGGSRINVSVNEQHVGHPGIQIAALGFVIGRKVIPRGLLDPQIIVVKRQCAEAVNGPAVFLGKEQYIGRTLYIGGFPYGIFVKIGPRPEICIHAITVLWIDRYGRIVLGMIGAHTGSQ